tara:strand:- start:19 stop:159 length:141 start_codon:yes stop_codon:yes gene_type:complete
MSKLDKEYKKFLKAIDNQKLTQQDKLEKTYEFIDLLKETLKVDNGK